MTSDRRLPRVANPLLTPDQQRMQELLAQLHDAPADEGVAIAADDLIALQHFVRVVRQEIRIEQSEPAVVVEHPDRIGEYVEVRPAKHGRAVKVSYYALNSIGLRLYAKWMAGDLDHLFESKPSWSKS